MKKYLKIIIVFTLFVSCFNYVLASDSDKIDQMDVQDGLTNTAYEARLVDTKEQDELDGQAYQGVNKVIGALFAVAFPLVPIIYLIIILYGGIMWMVAKGDQNAIQKAKNILIQATIAMALVYMAGIIIWEIQRVASIYIF